MQGFLEKVEMANYWKGGIRAWWEVSDLVHEVIEDGIKG